MFKDETEESEYLHKESCPACGSKDNLARYTDGHAWCFGCGHYEHADGTTEIRERKSMAGDLIKGGEYNAIKSRGITEKTCRHFGYQFAEYSGKVCHVAPYRDSDGDLVAQHIRLPGKGFAWVGDAKSATLWGQHLWRDGGKMVVVTEGEIDAMSVSQCQKNRWPVVSIHCGAGKPDEYGNVKKVRKHIAKNVEWLEKFETVVFMFDMDEQGRASAKAAASVLSPGKAKIASLPLHDANEMLKAKRQTEILDAVWGAKVYRPDGIVNISDLREEAIKPIEMGRPWCWDELTEATYGRRLGEAYGLGAGTGVGKTDFFTQQMEYDINTLEVPVGVFYLEQPVVETAKRVAGKAAQKLFHVPDAGWTDEEMIAAFDGLGDKVHLYDHFGETDWNVVQGHIRYMAVSLGVQHFYLDHLTAMADPSDERASLETIMKEMAGLIQELHIIIHYISHLATPEGKPHEEGGRVTVRHFKGSRAIGFWTHFMFGIERDCQAEDEAVRSTATFRILKDRYTGQSTGKTFLLKYDRETGMLNVTKDNPFNDETLNGDDQSDCPF